MGGFGTQRFHSLCNFRIFRVRRESFCQEGNVRKLINPIDSAAVWGFKFSSVKFKTVVVEMWMKISLFDVVLEHFQNFMINDRLFVKQR